MMAPGDEYQEPWTDEEHCGALLSILHAPMYEDVDPENWLHLFGHWMHHLTEWSNDALVSKS